LLEGGETWRSDGTTAGVGIDKVVVKAECSLVLCGKVVVGPVRIGCLQAERRPRNVVAVAGSR